MEGLLSILGKVGFDWQVALANFVNFLIIFFVLKKFAFKPIGKLIKERQDKIEQGLNYAQQSESALSNAKNKKEEIIKEAKEKAKSIILHSQETGKNLLKETKEEALELKDRIIKQANIEVEKEKLKNEDLLKKEASELIVSGIKKVFDGYIKDGKGDDIIKAMLTKHSVLK